MSNIQVDGRFAVVKKNYNLLLGLIVISAVGCFFLIGHLDYGLLGVLLISGLVSGLYTIPVIGDRRLRDYPFIKIFLIALVWTLITEIAPSLSNDIEGTLLTWRGIERFLFMIALTLPFDLRDIYIDTDQKVSTIAARLGHKNTVLLSFLLLLLCVLISFLSSNYLPNVPLLTMYGISAIAILLCSRKEHDYYFSGLLDGMMCVPYLVWYSMN